MRFASVQEKEIIEASSGKFIGYIVDAEVCEKEGVILAFIISTPKKFYHLFQGEEAIRKIAFSNILTVGKDVILVNTGEE